MKTMKKGILMIMLALFAVIAVPANTNAQSLLSVDPINATDSKGTTFTVSKSSVTVTKGKSTTVTVSLIVPKAAMLTAKASNKNVTMKWTGWNLKNNKLVITGASAGMSTITLKNSYNQNVRTIKVTVKNPSNPVTYRAAIVGQYDYHGYANDLSACQYDALAMSRTCKKTGYSSVKVKYNVSKNGMKNLISSAFAGADSNDVSLFFYSGHGASSGALCTIESGSIGFVETSMLATWLKKVPGTVIVMLDSCYSGMAINKTPDGKITVTQSKSVSDKEISNYNNAIINTFKKADAQSTTAKSGELATGKFRVITASSKYQTSGCYSTFSLFSYCIVHGAGFDFQTGARQSSAPADTNKNGIITVNEAWDYARMNTVDYGQDAKVYPANCSTKVFKR